MATLENKSVVVFGGSSGIGFAVAEASLKCGAASIAIVSSDQSRVEEAIQRLRRATTDLKGIEIKGYNVDATDTLALKKFVITLGEIDHIIWTSGDGLPLGFPDLTLERMKSAFDVRFWGPVVVAQNAKFRPGGSLTLTIGSVVVKPRKTWSIAAGVMGAVDSITRGLAVDLAPIRVNAVCPGLVKTELWKNVPQDKLEKMFEDAAKSLPVEHVAGPEEIAEAYLFLMKCSYITGQRIEVDGGYTLA